MTDELTRLRAALAAIEALCRRHNTPAVVTSTQILASKILKIIEATNDLPTAAS